MTDNIPYHSQLRKDEMKEKELSHIQEDEKLTTFVMDKIFEDKLSPKNPASITGWASLYFQVHVIGSPEKTVTAKKRDLSKFLSFYTKALGHDNIDGWTPAVTKQFQKELKTQISMMTGQTYKATTINRIVATVRHFGKWLHKKRPLLAGNPIQGVKDLKVEMPGWNGLNNRQIMRLKAACEQRLKACKRADQNPLLESAVFHVLLHTGLRESELVSLDVSQYHHRGFHHVPRKGSRVSKKIPLPSEAKLILDEYLLQKEVKADAPLFVSRYGQRLSPQDVARICLRIARQACTHLDKIEKFHLTPHMLRHTFLKRVADKHGVHVAQQMSGNVSIKEVFRYTKPSQDEMDEISEGIFN